MGSLFYNSILIIYLAFLLGIRGTNVNSTIKHCPQLEPRNRPPKDVLDLRIDDISYIASMGDSLVSGFGMDGVIPGILSILDPGLVTEYRGKSFASGADPEVATVANFLKYYNPDIKGGSVGKHLIKVCFGVCPIENYIPELDQLNAARTGARIKGFMSQVDYLEKSFKEYDDYKDKWKMIIIQLGINDACNACNLDDKYSSDYDHFTSEVEKVIQRIKDTLPKTVVYILGNFRISDLLYVNGKTRDCAAGGPDKNILLCPCGNTYEKVPGADETIEMYSNFFNDTAYKFAAKPGDDFGIIYFDPLPEQYVFPDSAFSNIDCFHFSSVAHEWLAKLVWNDLFADEIRSDFPFGEESEVTCASPKHRLKVTADL